MDNRHKRGLVSELKAAALYAERGFEIFWPSSGQSSVDFIAYKKGDLRKIQVKTGQITQTPNKVILSMNLASLEKYKDVDEFVCVFEDCLKVITSDSLKDNTKVNITVDIIEL